MREGGVEEGFPGLERLLQPLIGEVQSLGQFGKGFHDEGGICGSAERRQDAPGSIGFADYIERFLSLDADPADFFGVEDHHPAIAEIPVASEPGVERRAGRQPNRAEAQVSDIKQIRAVSGRRADLKGLRLAALAIQEQFPTRRR